MLVLKKELNFYEFVDLFGYLMELEGLEGDALIETVEDHLHVYTYLLGTFEEDGITFFIFDEF